MGQLGTMATARNHLMNLSRRVVDAESGQRGYLLTGRKEYLQPYRDAFADIDAALKWLNAYYALNTPDAFALLRGYAYGHEELLDDVADRLVRQALPVEQVAASLDRGSEP